MRSNKRRTTTSAGKSAKSKTAASAARKRNSSATPPASFESVFGKETHPEVPKLVRQLEVARERHAALLAEPVPTIALLRTRHLARLARQDRYVRDLQDAISTLSRLE